MTVTAPITSSVATAAAKGTPVKVGYICSCTGTQASATVPNEMAYKAWAAATNAAGGLNGHPIQLIVDDDQTNSANAISDVQALIQDHVVAIAEISSVDTTWASYVDKAHVPVIGTTVSSVPFYQDPNFFSPGTTTNATPGSEIEAAKRAGAKNFANLYCAESPICASTVPVLKADSTKQGVPDVYEASITASQPNYSAVCLAAKQAGAQALLIAHAAQVVERVTADCARQGYTPIEISSDGAVAQTFATSPGLSNNLLAVQPDVPWFSSSKLLNPMRNAFEKYQPGLLTNPNYGEESVEAWVAGELLAAAAKGGHFGGTNGKNPTSQQIYDGLYAMKNNTLGGLAPPLTFTKGKSHPVNCWFWMATKDSKFTTPYGLTTSCLPGTK